MSKSKILVTGATGSLGAALVRYFHRSGHEVIAHGRAKFPPKNLLKFAQYVSFDLLSDFDLPECDVCIHAAALSDDKANLADLRKVNVEGTRRLLAKLPSDVLLVHISSSSVYLPQDDLIGEYLAGQQNNALLSPYGLSKLETEQVVLENAKQKAVFVLRPRAFYGAGDCVILPRLLKLVKNDRLIQKPGSLEVLVSLTHYDTICKSIEACINNPTKGKHVYNISDHGTYVLIDVLRKMTKQIYGKTLQEKEVPIWVLKLMSYFKIGGITPLLVRSFTQDMVLDCSRSAVEIPFSSDVDFDKAIYDMAVWIKNNGGTKEIGNKSLAWSDDL